MPKNPARPKARLAKQALTADNAARAERVNQLEKKMGDLAKKLTGESKLTGDSYQNFIASLGMGVSPTFSSSTYGFNPITRVRNILEWIHRGSWLGGVAIDLVADDMTRAGVELTGDIDPDAIDEIEEVATALGVWNSLNDYLKWARLYGGCIAVQMIDGQDPKTPFRLESVGKTAFRGLFVLDRWQVEPSLTDLVQDLGPYYGLPKFYRVTSQAPGMNGMTIHYSRCIRQEGIRLPYWQRLMENLWGISVLERLYDRMVAFDSSTQGAAQLAYKAWVRTYKIKGFRNLVANGGKMYEALIKQVAFMKDTQTNEGMTLLDGDDEFEAHANPTFAGLSDLIMALAQQISGALQIPLVRLLGQSPAGLNSTGESDLRTYYDGIRSLQVRHLKVGITTVYRAIAQSMGMKLNRGFGIVFRPLWQVPEKEKADISTAITDAVVKAHEGGIISDQTALKELKQTSTVTGVFTNITREDIESASDVPVPPISEVSGEGEEGGAAPKAKKKKKDGDAATVDDKGTKAEAHYVDQAPGQDHCKDCVHFQHDQELGGTCELVSGIIKPEGYCEWFKAARSAAI